MDGFDNVGEGGCLSFFDLSSIMIILLRICNLSVSGRFKIAKSMSVLGCVSALIYYTDIFSLPSTFQ